MIIYLLTNRLNGKRYVGQTVNSLEYRLKRHGWPSSKCMPISLAFKKYGRENFSAEVLCKCATQAELNEKEKYWAIKLNTFAPNGYNLYAGDGYGAASPEMKRLISAGRKGIRHSDQTRARMSVAHTGLRTSDAARKKRAEWMAGRKMPAACLYLGKTYQLIDPQGQLVTITNLTTFCITYDLKAASMSEVARGKKVVYKGWRHPSSTVVGPALKRKSPSVETRAKLSVARKGKVHSAETRMRISTLLKGRKQSTETLMKKAAAVEARQTSPNIVRKKMPPHSSASKARISAAVKASWALEIAAGRSRQKSTPNKTYRFLHPSNQVLAITNLKAFCTEHGLCLSKMCAVAHGRRTSHKGWKHASDETSSYLVSS